MRKPHILLITIDSLRADHLSTYGYARETSPNIDIFSSEATAYENAFSAANWTGASLASVLTGLYPTVHGYTNRRYYLDADVPSVASILKNNGYFTTCFSNNMYLSSKTGLSRGFDQFFYQGKPEMSAADSSNGRQGESVSRKIKEAMPMRARSLAKDVLDNFHRDVVLTRDDGACATESAFFEWLNHYDSENPFFAYIHYQEPHSIYFPPRPYRKRFFSGSWLEESKYLKFDHIGFFAGHVQFTPEQVKHYVELYDGEIAYLDWRLGRLFQFLRDKKIMDQTLVIITSDHGENMGEHNYFWHAFCLYDPLIRIPFIVRYPEWFEKDVRKNQLVQTVDIVPTILDGLGIEWNYKNDRQGMSFLNGTSREAALTETFNPEMMIDRWLNRRKDLRKQELEQYIRDLRTIQTQDEKLVWTSDGWHEFYDLHKDRGESENLYDSADPRVRKMEQDLHEWVGSFRPHVADDTQPGFDKSTWMKMKDLGYA